MKNKIKYIGVIGGNGSVGGLIVNYLLSELSDQHILISYRTSERVPTSISSTERTKYCHLDYNNENELKSFCSRCFVVINAAGPSSLMGNIIALQALNSECHYIDIGGYDSLMEQMKPYEDIVKAKGLCFVIGAGWMPGLSGVFAKYIIEQHLNVNQMKFRMFFGAVDTWSYSSTYDMAKTSITGFSTSFFSYGKRYRRSPLHKDILKSFSFLLQRKICIPIFDNQLVKVASIHNHVKEFSTYVMVNDFISMFKFMWISIFYKIDWSRLLNYWRKIIKDWLKKKVNGGLLYVLCLQRRVVLRKNFVCLQMTI